MNSPGKKFRELVATEKPLQCVGAINAYLTLWEANPDQRPSLNFLYALVGALEGRSWLNVAQEDRYRLLMELEGFEELKKILDDS